MLICLSLKSDELCINRMQMSACITYISGLLPYLKWANRRIWKLSMEYSLEMQSDALITSFQNRIWDSALSQASTITTMKELYCIVLIYCMNSSMWAVFIAAIGKHLFKQNVSVWTTASSEFLSERWKVDVSIGCKTQNVSSATLQEIGMPNCGPSSTFLLN